jgi:hypothetical protein
VVPAPLTEPSSGGSNPFSSLLASAVSLAQKARKLPLGAVWGLALALLVLLALHYLAPGMKKPAWVAPAILATGVFAGVGIERSLHLMFGWNLDPKIQFLRSKKEGDLKFDRLKQLTEAGVFSEKEAHQIAVRLGRIELLGRAKPRGPRGPYKKRPPADSTPSGS